MSHLILYVAELKLAQFLFFFWEQELGTVLDLIWLLTLTLMLGASKQIKNLLGWVQKG